MRSEGQGEACFELVELYVSNMPIDTFKAHFDGANLILDEPADLPINASLLVTVQEVSAEHEGWTQLALANLSRAYGVNEPEYTLADLKEQ